MGVQEASTLLVHSSLKALGWVSGGPAAVLQAMSSVVTARGNIVMPSQSQDLTDPAGWEAPPVPLDWFDAIRASMPAFDPQRTPSRDMGVIAELFRTWPEVLRSNHPTSSFAAWGAQSSDIIAEQSLTDPFGVGSPLARLYDLNADILLIGVGFDCCTALHHAERLAWPNQKTRREGSPILVNGQRVWTWYETPVLRTELFDDMGSFLRKLGLVRKGQIGHARCEIMSIRPVIDAVVELWRDNNISGAQQTEKACGT
ncbi:aminoglycoside N(3)-acetyltransferase [Acetobacter pomorum]